jgi:peptidoglycan/LPS O-acetylase OafA/YrhL
MRRTSWSNLFVGLALVNLALAFWPHNPVRTLDWIALPACVALGAMARRRMVS